MSEYLFGSGTGKLPVRVYRKAERIAAEHGADLVNPKLERGYRYWFSGPDRGEPFNRQLAAAVYADLEKAGIDLAKAAR